MMDPNRTVLDVWKRPPPRWLLPVALLLALCGLAFLIATRPRVEIEWLSSSPSGSSGLVRNVSSGSLENVRIGVRIPIEARQSGFRMGEGSIGCEVSFEPQSSGIGSRSVGRRETVSLPPGTDELFAVLPGIERFPPEVEVTVGGKPIPFRQHVRDWDAMQRR